MACLLETCKIFIDIAIDLHQEITVYNISPVDLKAGDVFVHRKMVPQK
jgi:hypothetical protein